MAAPEPGVPASDVRRRGGPRWEVAAATSDPQAARGDLLVRDAMSTERLGAPAQGLGLEVLEVDTTTSQDDLTEQVAARPGL